MQALVEARAGRKNGRRRRKRRWRRRKSREGTVGVTGRWGASVMMGSVRGPRLHPLHYPSLRPLHAVGPEASQTSPLPCNAGYRSSASTAAT
ncbi:hypothetical protein E2C01_013311 [Portunus trituberculatus]|uniref:Uncharacterized protein n=1 Tax=Portunus trituberculatus TaxID=210409 RepID=A0A5B7DGR1_PORTR|nr:hypothetical protein [Portunus trituberculatus]